MQGQLTNISTIDHLSVITLKRTPHRLQVFSTQCQALESWNVHVLEGIDGVLQKNF